jgi:hypothetical protein
MFGLSRISTAVNRLVKAVTALAQTVEQVNEGVRETLRLDAPARPGRGRKVSDQKTAPAPPAGE